MNIWHILGESIHIGSLTLPHVLWARGTHGGMLIRNGPMICPLPSGVVRLGGRSSLPCFSARWSSLPSSTVRVWAAYEAENQFGFPKHNYLERFSKETVFFKRLWYTMRVSSSSTCRASHSACLTEAIRVFSCVNFTWHDSTLKLPP
jgi:hypothetical protein